MITRSACLQHLLTSRCHPATTAGAAPFSHVPTKARRARNSPGACRPTKRLVGLQRDTMQVGQLSTRHQQAWSERRAPARCVHMLSPQIAELLSTCQSGGHAYAGHCIAAASLLAGAVRKRAACMHAGFLHSLLCVGTSPVQAGCISADISIQCRRCSANPLVSHAILHAILQPTCS